MISFLEELFSRWGLPTKIITDNGKQFESRQFEDIFKSLGIEHARPTLYHPPANKAVECINRFLTDQLRLARVENSPVDNALFIALSMHRSTRHCTTQKSPAELMCARGMAMPLNRLRKLAPPTAFSFQLDNDVRRSRRNERNYNACKHASPFHVSEGHHVHVRDNIRSNKSELMWTQPRLVKEQIGDSTARLDNGTVRNAADLVPARPQTPPPPLLLSAEAVKPLQPQPAPTPAVESPCSAGLSANADRLRGTPTT